MVYSVSYDLEHYVPENPYKNMCTIVRNKIKNINKMKRKLTQTFHQQSQDLTTKVAEFNRKALRLKNMEEGNFKIIIL